MASFCCTAWPDGSRTSVGPRTHIRWQPRFLEKTTLHGWTLPGSATRDGPRPGWSSWSDDGEICKTGRQTRSSPHHPHFCREELAHRQAEGRWMKPEKTHSRWPRRRMTVIGDQNTHTHTHMVNRESANVAGSVLLPGIARHPPPAPLPLHWCAIGFASSQLFLRHYVWHGEWAFTLHLGRGLACVFYVFFFLDLVLVLFSIFLRARSLSLSLTLCFWWPIAYRGSCAYRDTNQWRLTSKQRGNVAQTCDREML